MSHIIRTHIAESLIHLITSRILLQDSQKNHLYHLFTHLPVRTITDLLSRVKKDIATLPLEPLSRITRILEEHTSPHTPYDHFFAILNHIRIIYNHPPWHDTGANIDYHKRIIQHLRGACLIENHEGIMSFEQRRVYNLIAEITHPSEHPPHTDDDGISIVSRSSSVFSEPMEHPTPELIDSIRHLNVNHAH
jgi:hypothetical protein